MTDRIPFRKQKAPVLDMQKEASRFLRSFQAGQQVEKSVKNALLDYVK